MKIASEPRRTSQTRSAAARRAASRRQANRRRRAQRKRQFAQQWRHFESALSVSRRLLPDTDWHWPRLGKPSLTGFHPSKLLSLALLIGVIGLLYWFQDNDAFFVYRENVHFNGIGYLDQNELFDYCDVESWSVLWLDPALIRRQVMRHSYVADAHVRIRWPANVTIDVEEVTPSALWVTDLGERWLLADGSALVPRAQITRPLIRIIDGQAEATTLGKGPGEAMNRRLLDSARTLADRIPGLQNFWYNKAYGLTFALPNTKTWVYWGDERNFEKKWIAYEAARPQLLQTETDNLTFNVSAPDRPFLRRYETPPTVTP